MSGLGIDEVGLVTDITLCYMLEYQGLSISPMCFPMTSTQETRLNLKLEALQDAVEMTLHKINNRMTVGSSHVDLLAMHAPSTTATEHLDALARFFPESASLHSHLVKFGRRLLPTPHLEQQDILLKELIARHTPLLELAAQSRHRHLTITISEQAHHAVLTEELALWVELFLLRLCRASPRLGNAPITLEIKLAPPSTSALPRLDTRTSPIHQHASHLTLALTHELWDIPPVDDEDDAWMQGLLAIAQWMLSLTPGALWLGHHLIELELALPHHILTEASEPLPPEEPTTSSRPFRCLIIDDEQAMLGPLQRILKYQGYEVLSFDSPIKALRHVQEQPDLTLDIALVDYAMNELNGLQTLEALRHHHPELPAIIMTGMPDDALIQSLELDPHSVTLSKPWDMTTLLDVLTAQLHRT